MNPDPLLLDIPERLETARLLIRCPAAGDGAIVHASVVESLAELRRFPASLGWAMAEPSVEASERFCREGHAGYLQRTGMPMLLFDRSTGEHVGNSGLHRFDWSVPKCEIGWWVRTSRSGRGLMLEAVRAITAFAQDTLGMRRIEALPDDLNVASCRLCERAGYTLEGTLRHERKAPDGALRNTRLYAFVR
jgi:RimJ/RimL family protein N-acetyltransferase